MTMSGEVRMDINGLTKQHLSEPSEGDQAPQLNPISDETILTHAKVVEPGLDITRQDETAPDPTLFLFPLWFLMLFTLVSFAVSEAWRSAQIKIALLKHAKKTPCKDCQYFSNNAFLKCAVRPSDALTDRAASCTDFRPQVSDEASSKKHNAGGRKL